MIFSIYSQPQSDEFNYNLKAIVDIGSNGIRFSISSTDPSHARIFPCLYKDRAAISLFDAQHAHGANGGDDKKKRRDGKSKKTSQSLSQSQQTPTTDRSGATTVVSTAIHSPTSPYNTQIHVESELSAASTNLLANNKATTKFSLASDDELDGVEGEPIQPIDNLHKLEMTVQEAEAAAQAAATDKNDIPDSVIHDVVFALLRFKSVCEDFHVPKENIQVVATEATREAPNSAEFRKAIYAATGWEVALLSKMEEARCGSFGVASSFNNAHGLFMDLGGGSTQLSWISCLNGDLRMSETPVSLPYGAAALTRRLTKAPPPNTTIAEQVEHIYQEIKVRLQDAVNTINLPEDMLQEAQASGGFKLYVSGGGFRGLGNMLLSRGSSIEKLSVTPAVSSTRGTSTPNATTNDELNATPKGEPELVVYPIPIINGFSCTTEPLKKLIDELSPLNISAASVFTANGFDSQNASIEEDSAISALMQRQMIITGGKKKLFRVSERRANQLPAVMLLVRAILDTLMPIRKVLFSQGGVREGVIFHSLPAEIRMQDPLMVATQAFRPKSYDSYYELLARSLPSYFDPKNISKVPDVIRTRLLWPVVNSAFVHSSYPKELQAFVAMKIALTGIISDAHGLSHEVRALLGLALSQRWGGETPDKSLRHQLLSLLSNRQLGWWALYVGHVMHVIGGVYPGGTVRDREDDEKKEIFSLRTELFEYPGDVLPPVSTEGEEGTGVTDGTHTPNTGTHTPNPGVGKPGKLKKSKNSDRFQFILRIRASTTSFKTSAPMVRSRINNLEKKLKKLTKEFGSDACKVHVVVDWV